VLAGDRHPCCVRHLLLHSFPAERPQAAFKYSSASPAPELKLTWAEVPGQPAPPAPERLEDRAATWSLPAGARDGLNCFLAPGYDPLAQLTERMRLLQGAGRYLEQSFACLEPASAAATWRYVTLAGCHGTSQPALADRRGQADRRPRRPGQAPGAWALGCGDGLSEAQLVGHFTRRCKRPQSSAPAGRMGGRGERLPNSNPELPLLRLRPPNRPAAAPE